LQLIGQAFPPPLVTFPKERADHPGNGKRDMKPIYTAVNAGAARDAFEQLTERWGQRYPAIIRLWGNAWDEFIPFLDYDAEIRRVLCSTNAIESLNARYRRGVKARGHFPSEQAALKCLYLVTRSLDPTGKGRARWAMRWKPALNASRSPSPTDSRPLRPTNQECRTHR
jgi:putative transposase